MFKKFKVVGRERIREETFRFYVDAGKDGQLRVIVYPNNTMQVLSSEPIQYLQSDLSDAQQKMLLKQVAGFGGELGDTRRDDCARKLAALQHGDLVRIGGKNWEVWRNASDRGAIRSIEVFVIRAGSKGTKLHKLVIKDVEQCRVDVCLVNGMGDVIQGSVASGPLP